MIESEPGAGALRKEHIRKRVWDLMEELGVARPPRPVHGRIPNFEGAARAAARLTELEEFRTAKTVKVNPDSPQRPVREAVLHFGKTLVTPTPRLRGGFLVLDPRFIPDADYGFAATIKGSFKHGRKVDLRNLPKPDLLIMGSVAVSRDGARIGKGGGYSELEYGILSELGLISKNTPVATTVHEVQIVDYVPMESHDLKVDVIATTDRNLKTNAAREVGHLFWDSITEQMINDMPILRELR